MRIYTTGKDHPNWKHGCSGNNTLYRIWSGMRTRCTNKNRDFWHRYGGRGIKVCKRWEVFEHFKSDMGQSYKKGLQLERKDNDGDYSPENCVWATPIEQQNNTCNNKFVVFMGERKTIADWSRETGLNVFTLYDRFRKGWAPEKALTTQPSR